MAYASGRSRCRWARRRSPVYPDGDLALEIQATEKKSKAKIEIAIAWRRRPLDTDTDGH
jgi:hypothetical protein